jgi:3-deoxy-D-manno-octulosonate 8-phosphate phosphatase (KDO 8-P phosphatase)
MLLSPDLITARARSLKLLLFDVDGVLTDNTVSLPGAGPEAKRFFIRDGLGLVWAQRAELLVGFLSGRASDATTRRAAELGITILIQGQNDKRAAYTQIVESLKIGDAHVAYMGDDLLDLPVLSRVGLSAAPADAVDDVRSRVHWVSRHGGGRGAAREFIEVILEARGRWDAILQSFLT